MMRTVLKVFAAVLVLPWMSLGQPTGREVDLRPKFFAGQQARFKMEMTNTSGPLRAATPKFDPKNTTKPTDPVGEESRSKTELTFSLKTASVSETGEATVNLVFEAIKISTSNKDGAVEFDSSKPAKPDDDLVAGLLRPLVGSTMTLKVDKAGNISSIQGGEGFSALGQFVGGGGGGAGGGGDLFGSIFTARKGAGMARVGESWEDSDKIDNALLGQFKMTTRHTLRSAFANEARVDMTGRIEPGTEAPTSGAGQVKDSSFTGSYVWDTERGMLKHMDSTMKVRMETSAGGARTETHNDWTVKVTQVR